MNLTRLLFLLCVLLILPISAANACKCDGSPSVKGAYESAHTVLGKVARMRVVSLAESMNPKEVVLLEKELDFSKKQSLHGILIMKVELSVTQVFGPSPSLSIHPYRVVVVVSRGLRWANPLSCMVRELVP